MPTRLLSGVAAVALLASCVSAPGAGDPGMSAEIRRTAYGVPHIKANDYAGLGYGLGYAAAEDNVCEIAERFLTVSGERAKFLGRGENDAQDQDEEGGERGTDSLHVSSWDRFNL